MTEVSSLLAALARERRVVCRGVHGSAVAYVVAQWRRVHADTPLLVITPDATRAERVLTDVEFFSVNAADAARIFPARELPHASLPTPAEQLAERLAVLTALRRKEPGVVIAPIAACLQSLPPCAHFDAAIRVVHVRDTLDRDVFVQWLVSAGYDAVPLAEDIGTFAVRGALVDCWPPGAPYPVRIELEDDVVVSLRAFDPATQRSRDEQRTVTIGPATEWLLTDDTVATALQTLRARADEHDIPGPARRAIIEALQQRQRTVRVEHFAPWLSAERCTLADYFPPNARVFWVEPAEIHLAVHTAQSHLAAAFLNLPPVDQLVLPTEQVVSLETLQAALHTWPSCGFGSGADTMSSSHEITLAIADVAQLRTQWGPVADDPLTPIAEFLRGQQRSGIHATIVCHTSLAAERTLDLLRWHGLEVRADDHDPGARAMRVVIGDLSEGFLHATDGIFFLTETELFGRKIRKVLATTKRAVESFISFQDLDVGDALVHEQHGIGRYLGLTQMVVPGTGAGDFVQLEYLGGDKLYLPVYRLHLLQRYIGPAEGAPLLDRLGGTRWSAVRKKALQSIRTMANELLKIYAARRVRIGVAFSGRDHALEEFEARFPYDETPDQWQAIEDTLRDMQSERPMDRLVCGDVGYGKTEIAMRAAFRAVMDGYQVAVLCPTTLLAYQHEQTFRARFSGTAVRIEQVSRLQDRAKHAEVVKATAAGMVDILIGTHRLLQRDVQLPRFGLLVIDEEQRFGVTHKERLRKLRATVDTLTLTATPIPRTLHMTLSGLRDISIIQTPPANRHAIRTHVVPFDDRVIREAMTRELARGGQIFFVHNRVQTIRSMQDHLLRLIPTARIVVAHGQLDELALEEAMRRFMQREADILLCTSIIEAGLDIPAANTLLVNRADTFGLAQLYQIRGRVGRASVQAAAYLLIPAHASEADGTGITEKAHRRLATLARYTELGSGFSIAMHDLEMRGAGNLLGGQQSGHIAEIGYELFTRLLERMIRELQGEPEVVTIDPEISVPVPALLPATYISDQNIRLAWYKRLSSAPSADQLEPLEAELRDRFGPLPVEVRNLLQVIALRIEAMALGIEQLVVAAEGVRLRFHASTCVNPQHLLRLVERQSKRYQLKPDGTLFVRTAISPDDIFSPVREVLLMLRETK